MENATTNDNLAFSKSNLLNNEFICLFAILQCVLQLVMNQIKNIKWFFGGFFFFCRNRLHSRTSKSQHAEIPEITYKLIFFFGSHERARERETEVKVALR